MRWFDKFMNVKRTIFELHEEAWAAFGCNDESCI